MRRLLLIALLALFHISVFAQAGSLKVTNTTNCTAYFIIRADQPPLCGSTFTSSIISISPGTTINYPTSMAVPGFPSTPLFMSMAGIYERPLSCGLIDPFFVGEPCTGLPHMLTYPVYTTSCALCNPTMNVQWLPASSPGGLAQLRFF